MGQAELAEAVTAQGVPMRLNTVSRIENGLRSTDITELLAIAVALGDHVSPNRLLIGPEAGEEPIALTPNRVVEAYWAWRWAAGDGRLPDEDGIPVYGDRTFPQLNRPHDPPDLTTVDEVASWSKQLAGVDREIWRAVRELGIPARVVLAYARMLEHPIFHGRDGELGPSASEDHPEDPT